MRRVALVAAGLMLVPIACAPGQTEPSPSTEAVATSTAGPTTTAQSPAETTSTEVPVTTGKLSAWEGGRAWLTVPLNHDEPDGPTVDIRVHRSEATDPDRRVGVLFVNPGGPGFPAEDLAVNADQYFSPDLLASFDIVAPDPRGTFPGMKVDCGSGLAEYFSAVDFSPDTEEEVGILTDHIEASVAACDEANPGLLEHISTMDTVHDLALLVGALGEDHVSWLGFSYGTILGAAFVTAYPDLVRAAVFDGAYYPNGYGDPLEEALVDAEAQEELLLRLIDECEASPDCPVGDSPLDALVRVSARSDAEPFDDDPNLPAVNQGALIFTLLAGFHAYGAPSDLFWSTIGAADVGDGRPLQRYYSEVANFQGSGGATLPINCIDYPTRGEPPLSPESLPELQAAAPTLYEVFPVPEGFEDVVIPSECDLWPAGPDVLPIPLTGDGAGPVLVVTATGDPVTPEGSAALLADDLVNETVLVVEDDQHVSYDRFGPPARRCAAAAIDAFLIDLTIPTDTTCGA